MRIRQTFEPLAVVWWAHIQDVGLFIEQDSFVQLCGRDHVDKRGSTFNIILKRLCHIMDVARRGAMPETDANGLSRSLIGYTDRF